MSPSSPFPCTRVCEGFHQRIHTYACKPAARYPGVADETGIVDERWSCALRTRLEESGVAAEMCFVILPFCPTTPMPAEYRFGHNPRICEDESSSQRSYERERWMEMTHLTGDYETGRNICQHVSVEVIPSDCLVLSRPHKTVSSARRGRPFLLVGVNQHTGFFMISAIEMKGEGGCEGGKENNSSTKLV